MPEDTELLGETEPQTQADAEESHGTGQASALPECWGRLIPLPPNKSPIIELREVTMLLGKGTAVGVKFDDPRIRYRRHIAAHNLPLRLTPGGSFPPSHLAERCVLFHPPC